MHQLFMFLIFFKRKNQFQFIYQNENDAITELNEFFEATKIVHISEENAEAYYRTFKNDTDTFVEDLNVVI